ncbi:PadR family transcriptional regulator [Kutzneria albida]|uniref:PadR family transcription regulator n=1 Tax=Kutzneria albida DSM 43870 TaxID=1449976 RepID=W5WCG8_9PSEU|nr:PadR family transcriptional regulator [Kutzneria albida]AHH95909.1 PadR family transcription regulator [Kutzneria albida DSM 43870]
MATAKLTPLALAVLELLAERPMHPYEIAQLMRERQMDRRVKVKAGSLYHTVERLHGQELIEVVDTQRDGRRPERTVYGMTEAGRAALVARASEIIGSVAEEYPEFTSGLGVVNDLDREQALTQLRRREQVLVEQSSVDELINAELTGKALPPIYWLDFQYVRDLRAFELAWTRRLIEDIDSGRLRWQPRTAHENGTP